MAWLVATFFGIGRIPKGQGTAASLVSLVFWVPLAQNMQWWVYGATWLALTALGFWATAQVLTQTTEQDPRFVVIDEVSGMGLACFLLPAGWIWTLLAFGLFRIFDIWKMGWIAQADKQLKGASGVMVDDILAGAAAWILCQGAYYTILFM